MRRTAHAEFLGSGDLWLRCALSVGHARPRLDLSPGVEILCLEKLVHFVRDRVYGVCIQVRRVHMGRQRKHSVRWNSQSARSGPGSLEVEAVLEHCQPET